MIQELNRKVLEFRINCSSKCTECVFVKYSLSFEKYKVMVLSLGLL